MMKSKKEVIVMTARELTKKERREYAQKHPGKRLCFRLRYPNFPLWFSVAVLVLQIIAMLKIWVLQ